MKIMNSKFYYLLLFITVFATSCNSDDDNKADNQEAPEYVTETKASLTGEWRLVSSKIDEENVSSADFECLKNSLAEFKDDNTYKLNFKKRGSSTSSLCTETSSQSGTYTVTALNNVTFFNSTSEIKLIDDTLQITTVITGADSKTQTQVDIFVRSDNDEFEEPNTAEEPEDVEVAEDETTDNTSTYDGSVVVAKLLGKWKIDGASDDCLQKNTIEFTSGSILEFIQHQKNFNRSDLLKNNANVSYPMPKQFKIVVNSGIHNVTFDTEADCKFIKKSTVEYVVTDEKTVLFKNSPNVKILVEDDSTIKLNYEYTDKDSNKQTIEFTYVKI